MYGKTKYRRKYARKGRSNLARLAKGSTTAVQTLARKVRRIAKMVSKEKQYLNYAQRLSYNVSADVQVVPLSQYATWTRVFGTDVDDEGDNVMKHLSFAIDSYITLENSPANEPDTTSFTCFLVSLKDQIGSAFSPVTGLLNLTPDLHYSFQGGLVMLSKKVFNIHKVKRFTLTNHGTNLPSPSAQSQYGTDRRWYWKMRINKEISNPTGDWKVMNASPDPSDNYFMLIFNDNASLDLQNPSLRCSAIHSISLY